MIQARLFRIYRDTVDDEEELRPNKSVIASTHFDANKKTKFVIHGWTHNAHRKWVQDMVAELLKKEDVNVIAVDWSHGAGLPYGQATANTRVVGAQTGQLINFLIANTNATADNFHLVGHSLGAHVAGYAGEKVNNMSRITGLDPAEPYFQDTDPVVRLDPTDAKFVDVIHTDGSSIFVLGLGAKQPMGHVDFYPNGGHEQPGCDHNILSKLVHTAWNAATIGYYGAEAAIACSHMRSCYLFTESINSKCPFQAYPCASANEFNKGGCLQCYADQCSYMGYHADKSLARGSLYLNTQSSSKYCSYHYQVTISSGSNMDGVVKIKLHGGSGDTATKQLMKTGQIVNANNDLSHLITSPKSMTNITGITISYNETSNFLTRWMYPDDWKIASVSVFEGETQATTTFCAYGKDVQSHSHTDLAVTGHCT
ncbi:pancreatic triacylglycerol lipase-like [Gigantopelta aegis]|uniref:pancreatic triacylglycerol lipase-like n=1 Tax=Gigantopelta aegis TaxID=1735272 RepID=UPI001B888724|nr:pancreatic triacylglycerol lipase-like [Gigantopelta aegis]